MAKHPKKKRSKFSPTPSDELAGTGMTIGQLAGKLKVSPSTFIGWLTGRIPGPSDLGERVAVIVGHCPGCGRPAGEPCAERIDQVPSSSPGVTLDGEATFAPLHPSRAAFLENRFLAMAEAMPRLGELRARLLEHGGVGLVSPPSEPDMELILNEGRVFDGRDAVLAPGEPSSCHTNVRLIWLEHGSAVVQVMTGYCLSPDGLWRQHSWALKDGTIVETTLRRLKYFGAMVPHSAVFSDLEHVVKAATGGAR